jgi:hypothetical protein
LVLAAAILIGALAAVIFVGLVVTGSSEQFAPGWTGVTGRRPWVDDLLIRDSNGHLAARIERGRDSSFEVRLPPGNYDLIADGDPCRRSAYKITVLPGFHTAVFVEGIAICPGLGT